MRVTNVILRVRDLARSIAFYRDRVGLTVISATSSFAFLDAGSVRIGLNEVGHVPPDSSLTEIVLEVDNLRVAYAQMHDRGVPFEVEPRVVDQEGPRSLVATHFRDPDGHLLSISGWE